MKNIQFLYLLFATFMVLTTGCSDSSDNQAQQEEAIEAKQTEAVETKLPPEIANLGGSGRSSIAELYQAMKHGAVNIDLLQQISLSLDGYKMFTAKERSMLQEAGFNAVLIDAMESHTTSLRKKKIAYYIRKAEGKAGCITGNPILIREKLSAGFKELPVTYTSYISSYHKDKFSALIDKFSFADEDVAELSQLELEHVKSLASQNLGKARQIEISRCGPGVQSNQPHVSIKTSEGTFILELRPDKTPLTVSNFLKYVKAGFYDNTIMHRAEQGYVIQLGGVKHNLQEKEPLFPPIKNESKTGLSNIRGVVAMARAEELDSADAHFYINLTNNSERLDHEGPYGGYTGFGQVVSGMDVVDVISLTEIGPTSTYSSLPAETITIYKAELLLPKLN